MQQHRDAVLQRVAHVARRQAATLFTEELSGAHKSLLQAASAMLGSRNMLAASLDSATKQAIAAGAAAVREAMTTWRWVEVALFVCRVVRLTHTYTTRTSLWTPPAQHHTHFQSRVRL